MTNRVYNFSGGPAMLPIPVMETVQKEFLDFHGLGASITGSGSVAGPALKL